MNRKEILEKIAQEQQKVVDNLQESVQRYKSASDIDEDDTLDPDDYARQTEAKDMQLRYEQMLNAAKQNLAFLMGDEEKTYDVTEEGSIAETADKLFFLGSSVPHFSYNGKEVYCISRETPVYKNIIGKKVGDQVEIGNSKEEIISIF